LADDRAAFVTPPYEKYLCTAFRVRGGELREDEMADESISQFFENRCQGPVCVLPGLVAALGPLDNFRIAVHLG